VWSFAFILFLIGDLMWLANLPIIGILFLLFAILFLACWLVYNVMSEKT
jgi:hypothetical protein